MPIDGRRGFVDPGVAIILASGLPSFEDRAIILGACTAPDPAGPSPRCTVVVGTVWPATVLPP